MPQDKLTAVRIKQQNGTYGPQIPVGAKAENVKYDNTYSVKEVLGNVNTEKGPLQEQIDDIDATAISEAVTEWLEDNPGALLPTDKTLSIADVPADAQQAGKIVTVNSETDGNATKLHLNTTNEVVSVLTTDDIDDTFSIAGKVADAKAAGDQIGDLKNALTYNNNTKVLWKFGRINVNNGNISDTDVSNRIRTIDYLPDNISGINVDSGWKYLFAAYTNTNEYVGVWDGSAFVKSSAWLTRTTIVNHDYNYNYRVILGKNNDSTISIDDYEHIGLVYTTDSTLSKTAESADAKVVGEKFADANLYADAYYKDLFLINGYMFIKWKLGGISRNSDGTLNYKGVNTSRISTDRAYFCKRGSSFALSSYDDYRLLIYTSVDGIVFNETTESIDTNRPKYDVNNDQYCAFVIIAKTGTQSDTSASSLFVVTYNSLIAQINEDIDSIEEQVTSNANAIASVTDNFDRLMGDYFTGETQASKTIAYKFPLTRGHTYKFTNVASQATTMNVYAGNTATPSTSNEIIRSLAKNYIRYYTSDDDYKYIYVYATAAANFIVEDIDGLFYEREDVPEYYGTYIEDKIREINDLQSDSGINGDKFIFMTDYHEQANAGNSHKLIRKLLDNTNMRFFLFGGDVQDYVDSISGGIDEIRKFNETFKNVKPEMYAILGNHEFNPFTSDNQIVEDYMLTYNQAYGMVLKDKEVYYGDISEYGNYWFDNKVQKIRYICTTTDGYSVMDKESVIWVLNAMKDTPSGYSIVILSHLTFDVSPSDNTKVYLRTGICWIAQAMDVYNQRGTYTYKVNPSDQQEVGTIFDFSECDAEALCIIGGHTHFDMDSAQEEKFLLPEWFPVMPDVMIVATTTDAYHRQNSRINPLSRQLYTVSEQAFDAVSLDTNNKILDMIRVGAGYNRTFHLENVTTATTLTTKLSGTIIWTSSNSSIATISNGIITPVGIGRTRIVATDENGNREVWTVRLS